MIRHRGGHARSTFVFSSPCDHRGVGGHDVLNFKVKRGVLSGLTVALRRSQHHPYFPGLEKCQIGARIEEELKSHHLTIKRFSGSYITDREGNLTNRR